MPGFDKNLINNYPKLEGMAKFPVLDNHMHLDPRGLKEEAIKDFQRLGGTHIVLVHKPYKQLPVTKADDFRDSFSTTLGLAARVRERTEVEVMVVVGPYPVTLLQLGERIGLTEAVEIMMRGMELAAEIVEEGSAVGLGEIGRPHFPVSREVSEASDDILGYGLELAAELKCPVHLHTEGGGAGLYGELAEMAEKKGCATEKVIKHFSGPMVLPKENHGLFPSVLCSSKNIRSALNKGPRFLMETDYIDDPGRPGAVMVPKTVPKRTYEMIEEGRLDREGAIKIHKEWPARIYDVEIGL